jgi:hypothetical protein
MWQSESAAALCLIFWYCNLFTKVVSSPFLHRHLTPKRCKSRDTDSPKAPGVAIFPGCLKKGLSFLGIVLHRTNLEVFTSELWSYFIFESYSLNMAYFSVILMKTYHRVTEEGCKLHPFTIVTLQMGWWPPDPCMHTKFIVIRVLFSKFFSSTALKMSEVSRLIIYDLAFIKSSLRRCLVILHN